MSPYLNFMTRFSTMLRCLLTLTLLIKLAVSGYSQELHTDFHVTARPNNKNFISWNNPYNGVIQINIQRSYDSVRNFKTILTVPDPKAVQNGFVDAKSPIPYPYYRILILMEGGKYLFSVAKRPEAEPGTNREEAAEIKNKEEVKPSGDLTKNYAPLLPGEKSIYIKVRSTLVGSIPQSSLKRFRDSLLLYTKDTMIFKSPDTLIIKTYMPTEPPKIITIKKRNRIVMELPQYRLKHFRDSIALHTKDTLQAITSDTILIKPFLPQVSENPSTNIYTDREGNVIVSLNNAPDKRYSIKFMGPNDEPLFSVGQVKEKLLRIDKSNFLESGWYWFELYESGQVIERNKFFIPKNQP